MKHNYTVIGLGVILLFLVGCGKSTNTPTALLESRAKVEAIQVELGDGGTVSVQARGQLPDGCTQLGEPVVSRGEGLVVVILPAYRDPAAQDCAGPQFFDQSISLGNNFSPGRYSVSVNGVEAVFDVGQPTGANPTPIPTEMPLPNAQKEIPALKPTPTPTQSTLNAGSLAAGQPCEVKGAFFRDMTVPDGAVFDPGEHFTKTWRIRNVGTCTWEGYSLVFQGGDRLGSQGPQPVPGKVAPGDLVDISIKFTAPQQPGHYYSDWYLSTADGQVFGLGNPPIGLLWLRIGVRTPPAKGNVSAPDLPQSIDTQPNRAACEFLNDPTYEARLLDLINAARQEQGLPALQLLDPLSAAARGHAVDMACHDFVEHYSYDGSLWPARIKAQGVDFRSSSENIYAGNPQFGGTPEGAFSWWMNSQVHRDNILNPKATQIGIGYAYYAGSTYKGYYTLNFVER